MRAVALALALAAVLAAATHIVIVFAVPGAAEEGLEAALPDMAVGGGFVPVDDPALFADRDPAVQRRVCAVNIADGPVRVEASIPSGYWSVSVHDRLGLAHALLNDRAAQNGRLTLLLATRRQARALDEAQRAEATLIRLPAMTGYVLLRALVDRPSQARKVAQALDGAVCEVTPVDLPPGAPQTLDELIGQAGSGPNRTL